MIWTPRKQQHQQRRRLQQKKVDVAEVDAMSQRKRRSASGRISPLVARRGNKTPAAGKSRAR